MLVATSGATVSAATGAGLHTVDIARGQGVDRPYEQLAETVKESELAPPELMVEVATRFGEMSELMLDGLVRTAKAWRADAIVYPPAFPAGLLAAKICGIHSVLHGFGLRRPTLMPAMEQLLDTASGWGVTALPRDPDLEISISPPTVEAASMTPDSMQGQENADALRMRYLPENGGAELPSWLVEESARPRVVVTLGSMPSTVGDGDVLSEIVRGAGDMDVELVLMSARSDLPGMPEKIPDNVRMVGWLPIPALLSSSSSIVHHGGMGSTFAAFAAGVPQVVVPHGGDRVYNAQVVDECGAGLSIPLFEVDEARVGRELRRILNTPGYSQVSDVISREMAGGMSPHDVVHRMTEIFS